MKKKAVLALFLAAALSLPAYAGTGSQTTSSETTSATSAVSVESKADESKADESKADESKADESKADESKADESKVTLTTEVKCNNGTFVGKATDELIIWKGIPYATQPVGKLRWQKALPAADDDGVYDAIEPGHVPIGPINDSDGTAEFGEDCLVLNIYCNTSYTDGRKPVMVWIHGSGFCAESQASPLYDLTSISKQYPDILFVSIDYRLGFLGFMNFERVPGGENFREAGNLGLLDQLEALRWIQKNIAGFGGDPDNVTIFGESAGSASVTFLPLIDGSEGLFKRCIAQSANIAYCDTMEHGIQVTQNFLTAAGCQTMVFDDAIGMQEDLFDRREDLMMSWAERLGNGSSKRVC